MCRITNYFIFSLHKQSLVLLPLPLISPHSNLSSLLFMNGYDAHTRAIKCCLSILMVIVCLLFCFITSCTSYICPVTNIITLFQYAIFDVLWGSFDLYMIKEASRPVWSPWKGHKWFHICSGHTYSVSTSVLTYVSNSYVLNFIMFISYEPKRIM